MPTTLILICLLFATLFVGNSYQFSRPSVLYLYYTTSPTNINNINSIAKQLQATGNFSSVETQFYANSTINYNYITKFDSVVVYSFEAPSTERSRLGSILDSALKSGKTGVVLSNPSFSSDGVLLGSWSDSDKIFPNIDAVSMTCNMQKLIPDHPILHNVGSVTSYNIAQTRSLLPGSNNIATCGGYPFVATKLVEGQYRRVDINVWLSNVDPTPSNSGDLIQLLANSLLWVAGQANRCQESSSCAECTVGQTNANAQCYWCPALNACLDKAGLNTDHCRTYSPLISDCPTPKCSDFSQCDQCVQDIDCVYCLDAGKQGCIDANGSANTCSRATGSEKFCPSSSSKANLNKLFVESN